MGEQGYQVLAIGLLIALSGLISATETALLALGPAGVHQILDEEHHSSRLLALWRDSPNSVIASILVANNVVNILASSLATTVAADVLQGYGVVGVEGWSVALSVGAMTLLLILFGEVLPKTFAKHNARNMVPFFPVTSLVCRLVRPVAWFFEHTSGTLIRAAGLKTGRNEPAVTEEEIESMIRLGTAHGALPTEKQELLTSIIDFSDTMTKEILVPRTDVVGFEVESTRDEALRVVAEHQYSRYPVYEGDLDTVVGIVNVKDLIATLARDVREPFSLRKMATLRRTMIVPETKKIGDLLKQFQREHVQMAVVVDEFGGTAGIVTVEDVLEEIVGEIYDEHDQDEEPIRETAPGEFRMDATCAIEDLEERFGLDLPDQDDYETVGGLVLTVAGRVPQQGDAVEFMGLRFEVLERTRTRVLALKVARAGRAQDGDGGEAGEASGAKPGETP